MYLGELCKIDKPCVVVRPGNRVVWNGRDLNPEVIHGPNVYLANDWEIEAPKTTKTTKVINWPEGTWGMTAMGTESTERTMVMASFGLNMGPMFWS